MSAPGRAELEPLLARLSSIAPHFGALTVELDALVSEGRALDLPKVMLRCRRVLEALLRSLIEDRRLEPGPGAVDELLGVVSQASSAAQVPNTILGHLRAVQAFCAEAPDLDRTQPTEATVGREEVVASLSSLMVILGWFAARRGIVLDANARTPPVPATTPSGLGTAVDQQTAVSAKPPQRGPAVLILGALLVVAVLGVAALLVAPRVQARVSPADPFAALDARYRAWREPAPPLACRRASDAERLAAIATDATALGLVDPNPEAGYLLARAIFERDQVRHPALDGALACPDFAAAHNLAGRIAMQQQDLDLARKAFLAAVAAEPTFLNARFNLALLLIAAGDLDGARDKLNLIIESSPDFGDAFLVRAGIEQVQGHPEAAARDACQAAKLGVEKAAAECARLSQPLQDH